MRSRSVVIVFAALLVTSTLAACGGGGGDATAPTVPATFPALNQEADMRAAKAMVLTKDDMPADYTESTRYPNFDQVPFDPNIKVEDPKACENVDLADSHASTAGKFFAKNESTPIFASVIASNAGLYESAEDVEAERRDLAKASTQLCSRRMWEGLIPLFSDALGVKATVQNVAVKPLPTLTTADTLGFRLTGTAALNRQTANFYLDVVTLFKDRSEVSFVVASMGTEPTEELHQSLLAKVRAKVPAGIAAHQKG